MFFFIKYINLNYQLAFREGHFTTLAFSELVEGVLSTYEKGETTVFAVLLDLVKAFGSVEQKKFA